MSCILTVFCTSTRNFCWLHWSPLIPVLRCFPFPQPQEWIFVCHRELLWQASLTWASTLGKSPSVIKWHFTWQLLSQGVHSDWCLKSRINCFITKHSSGSLGSSLLHRLNFQENLKRTVRFKNIHICVKDLSTNTYSVYFSCQWNSSQHTERCCGLLKPQYMHSLLILAKEQKQFRNGCSISRTYPRYVASLRTEKELKF